MTQMTQMNAADRIGISSVEKNYRGVNTIRFTSNRGAPKFRRRPRS